MWLVDAVMCFRHALVSVRLCRVFSSACVVLLFRFVLVFGMSGFVAWVCCACGVVCVMCCCYGLLLHCVLKLCVCCVWCVFVCRCCLSVNLVLCVGFVGGVRFVYTVIVAGGCVVLLSIRVVV